MSRLREKANGETKRAEEEDEDEEETTAGEKEKERCVPA